MKGFKGSVLPSEAQKVLVVDDNRDAAQTMAILLRYLGHDASVAFNGPDALQLASELKPDFVLLDIGMPGMNGYDVAQRLREQPETKDVFIIAVTGFGMPEDRDRSQAAGINLHLLKPINNEQLFEILRASPHAAAVTQST
ncbi:MAG: response regulator [Pirellulaceae bacterium]